MERPPKCPDECPGNTACDASGICHAGCAEDKDCADGFVCDDIYEECNKECVDEDCSNHFACDTGNTCNDFCFERSECQAGYRCTDNGECVN